MCISFTGAAISAKEQQERQLVLRTGCESTKAGNHSLDHLLKKRKNFEHIIVNDRHKLLYCYIPKVCNY